MSQAEKACAPPPESDARWMLVSLPSIGNLVRRDRGGELGVALAPRSEGPATPSQHELFPRVNRELGKI